MSFRRFRPRRGTLEDFSSNINTISREEQIYIEDIDSYVYLGPYGSQYTYSDHDYIVNNLETNSARFIYNNRSDNPDAFKAYLSVAGQGHYVNGFYSGSVGLINPKQIYTVTQDRRCQTGILNLDIIGVISASDVAGLNPVGKLRENGLKSVYFNKPSGATSLFSLTTFYGLGNLEKVTSLHNSFELNTSFILGDADLSYECPLRSLPRITSPSGYPADISIRIKNFNLKSLSFGGIVGDDSNSPYLTLRHLSGLNDIVFEDCGFFFNNINDTSIPRIDFSGFEGNWRRINELNFERNYNLTGFNIPYSGVGYRPTSALDDDAYVAVGLYINLTKTAVSASGLNDLFSKLVDLNGIVTDDYENGRALINVTDCVGTGQAGYDPTLATSKNWAVSSF